MIDVLAIAAFVYPYIQAPVFVLNSLYDAYQVSCILTVDTQNGACSSNATFNSCFSQLPSCSAYEVN